MKILYLTNLILLSIIFSNLAFGQEKTESVANKQVLLNVSVIDRDGELVTGLKAENFRLYEDKKPVEISYFNDENNPISIGFLIDVSPSSIDQTDLSRKGILAFLEKSNSENEYFIAAFSKKVDMLSGFAGVKETTKIIRESPYFLKNHGRHTALYDAVNFGIETFAKAKNQRRVLIIFGDGQDNDSSKKYNDIENAVKEKNITVYFIGFIDDKYGAGWSPLQKIAKISGGTTFYANYSVSGRGVHKTEKYLDEFLTLGFSSLSNRVQKQYVIGFKSKVESQENRWRKLEVKLELEKELKKKVGAATIRHREGYYPFSEIVVGN